MGLGGVALWSALSCGSDERSSEQSSGFILGDDVSGQGGGEEPAPEDLPQCLGETREAETIGLDMFVMLDISGSMLELLPRLSVLEAPRTKWDAVRSALQSFIAAPETADIGMGIQYFPQVRQDVPFSCTSNAECGESGGPCSNSVCVVREELVDPTGQLPPLSFSRTPDSGPVNCSADGECAAGETCRTIVGQCVISAGTRPDVPGGAFLNVSADPDNTVVSPLCSDQSDCSGLPGTNCEEVGICANQALICSATIGCPPGAGACGAFPYGCVNQTQCELEAYSTPAVEISSAPDRSVRLLESLRSQTPNGLTPTGPALSGALEHARAWALENPGRQIVTVLATDGFPTECSPVEIPEIAAIAEAAASAERPVRTFVVGVFGSADLGADGQERLDALARAGGTDRAYVINTGGNVVEEFTQALNEIRDRAVSCEFQLDPSGALDFDRVNLQVTDAAGNTTDLFSVGDVSACGDSGQGWYYVRDAAGVPRQINVCPGTCATFADDGISVNLQIGCDTRIQ